MFVFIYWEGGTHMCITSKHSVGHIQKAVFGIF